MIEKELPVRFRKMLEEYKKVHGQDEGYYILLSIFSTAVKDKQLFSGVIMYLNEIPRVVEVCKKVLSDEKMFHEEKELIEKLFAVLPPDIRKRVLELKKTGRW